MEFNLGVEPGSEYLAMELARGAMTLAKEVMLIKPGENVVITGDTSSDKRVVDATAAAVYAIGGVPTVSNYATAKTVCMDPPAPIAAAGGSATPASGQPGKAIRSCLAGR
jgi:hypothetical protein